MIYQQDDNTCQTYDSAYSSGPAVIGRFYITASSDCDAISQCGNIADNLGGHSFYVYYLISYDHWRCDVRSDQYYNSANPKEAPNVNVGNAYLFIYYFNMGKRSVGQIKT